MFKSVSTAVLTAVAFTLVLPGATQAGNDNWKQVMVKDSVNVKLADGSKREIKPSCSGGPIPTPKGIVAADTQYSFFVNKGDSKKILLALDGGGACWNALTCIGSPLSPEAFGGRPTYTPLVDETIESLGNYSGVLDSENPDNPYADYTKIFVPYCTADVHWGSVDKIYRLPPEMGGLEWTIHHRGADNLLAVLDWMTQNGVNLKNASHVSVIGASAGGYGTNLATAYVAEMTGDETELSMVADSSVGVIDNPENPGLTFYSEAIYNTEGTASWNVAANLPAAVFGDGEEFLGLSAGNPQGFIPSMFAALASFDTNARLASVTPNLDTVQIGFYSLMKRPDSTDSIADTAGQWFAGMAGITGHTAAALSNYRFFIDNSDCHTYIFSPNFYTRGIADWVSKMVNREATWDSTGVVYPDPESFADRSNCLVI